MLQNTSEMCLGNQKDSWCDHIITIKFFKIHFPKDMQQMHHKNKIRKNRSLFYRGKNLKNLSTPKKRGIAIFIMSFGGEAS